MTEVERTRQREGDEREMPFGVDSYLEWIRDEGVLTHEGLALNTLHVETRDWPRFGVPAAAMHFTGRGDYCSMFVMDIPAGGSSNPVHHLFEALHFVLEGRGSTQIEFKDGSHRRFEWGPRSFFAIPLNATYRHFNGSGVERARMCVTTNAPLIMKTFHNSEFVFSDPYEFKERLGPKQFYTGEGMLHLKKESGKSTWQTNFIPDLAALQLTPYEERGPGSTIIKMAMADSVMHAHISEIPPAMYKKAHRHGGGTHVLTLTGGGYSLLWYPGDNEYKRVDWEYGTVFPPLNQQMHQHFVTTDNASRYLATALGGESYVFSEQQRRTAGIGGKAASKTSIKEGGDQIEYEDQDPRIHALWLEEMNKAGVAPRLELPQAKVAS
jgi:mannose-6-phosphate isomerase-like protein (cupin superfamily)